MCQYALNRLQSQIVKFNLIQAHPALFQSLLAAYSVVSLHTLLGL